MAMDSARGAGSARRAREAARGSAAHGGVGAPRQVAARPASQANEAAASQATLDHMVIDAVVAWWRRQSPRARWASAGVALAMLAMLGIGGVASVGLPSGASALATPPTHASPIALVGRLLVALFGAGAYATLALPLGLGGLWLAEGAARRRLAPRWLAAPTVALWLLIELAARLFGGRAAGGALGDALAAPLAHAPLIVAQLLALLLAMLVALILGVTLAHHVASGVVALSGGALRAIKRLRSTHSTRSPGSNMAASGASAPRADSRVAHATATARDVDTDAAEDPAPIAPRRSGQPLVEAWVSTGTRGSERAGSVGVGACEAAPRERTERPRQRDDAVAQTQAEALARRTQQALLAQRAVAQVYPLRTTATTIRLCVRPVERLKRDAAGRLATDGEGAPIIVRTRVSRILALRDDLAEALGAPTLRLALLPPEEAPDVEQPALVVEIPRR